jgi:chromosome segregation ATPase
MNKKIVLWGNDAEDKKILIGIELIEQENQVKIYTYDELAATQEVHDALMNQWRTKEGVELPAGYQAQDRPLSVTDNLLPDDIKVERTDLISRAKAEWHFIVLSSKLYQMYGSELEDFKDKVDDLGEYSETVWNEMKDFWTKVQEQVREKNLFREHASDLRSKTNELFETLKGLKKSFQSEFKKQSGEVAAKYKEELTEIEAKIEKGLGLKPLFDQLKDVQARFKKEKFTKDDQRKLWNRIDKAFKAAKEKRFGDKGGQTGGALNRLQRRYDGLLGALQKMERSIGKDRKDLEWENKRIERTDGQLEMQIRQAKIVMIDERISSKQEKLDDMIKTKAELEKKIEQEKKREVIRAEKAKSKEVQKEIKQKIASEIKEAEQARAGEAAKLETLATKIVDDKKPGAKKPKDQPKAEEPRATASADTSTATDKVVDLKDAAKEAATVAAGMAGEVADEAKSLLQNAMDTVKAVADVVEDKIEDTVDAAKEKVEELSDDPEIKDIKTQVTGMIGGAIAALKDVADKVEDKVEEIVDDLTGEEE